MDCALGNFEVHGVGGGIVAIIRSDAHAAIDDLEARVVLAVEPVFSEFQTAETKRAT